MKVSKLLGLCFAILAIFVFAVSPVFAGGGSEDPWSEDEGGGNPNNGGTEPTINPFNPATGFEASTFFFGTDLWSLGLIWDQIVGSNTFNTATPVPDHTENEDSGNKTNIAAR